jgi:ABC-type bacteriocin/lantibiotic exporter with double-glycine peptidase domain
MFDLAIFDNPVRLKREFLEITEVSDQKMGPELQAEFDHIKEENPEILMGGNFWWDFVRTYKVHLSFLTFGRAVLAILLLVAVLASEAILDDKNSLTAALGFLGFYAVVQIVMKVVNAWTALFQSQIFVNVRTFITLRVNVKLLKMGQLSSNDFSTGNLKTLISSDVYRVGEFIHGVARNGLPCLLGLVILGPVIVYNMGLPGVIAMAVAFGAMPLSFLLGKYVHTKENLIKKEEDDLSTIIGEWVANVRLLRFLGWESLMRTRVAAHVRRLVIEATKQHGINLINFGVSVTWWLFPIVALIWANEVMGTQDDLVTLFASIWMLNHITLYIRWLPDIFISYASASACVNRINRLFLHRDISDDLIPATQIDLSLAVPIRLHVKNVSYCYEGTQRDVLKNISLVIDLSQRLSLIGSVGAGKSTLLKLLCAEMKPSKGQIEVEFDTGYRTDLWHEDVYKHFRGFIGYMPQEAYLSNTTLGINVALDTGHTDSDVMRAIQMAELEADIGHWERGLLEEVGETGVNLSGGQKQRVNLARALYSGRDYLVLDDPLSAVDSDTEASLMVTLCEVPQGFLLCSHRLTELKQTDRLLVMEDGEIIEDGKPLELMQNPHSEFSKQLQAGEVA